MFCPECGHKMKKTKGDYLYRESGLDNVVLKGITIYKCDQCGESMPVIPDLSGLHNAIAYQLSRYPRPLTGKMFQFIRKALKLTATELARILGVTKQTVSRWENDKAPVGEANDKLIRMIYIQTLEEKCGKVFGDSVEKITSVKKSAKRGELIAVPPALWKKLCGPSPVKAA